MFWIQCKDGKVFTQKEGAWDALKLKVDEHGGILKAALIDDFHIAESMTGADGYCYYTEAVSVVEHRVVSGQWQSRSKGGRVTKEMLAGFWRMDTLCIRIDNHIRLLKLQLEKILKQHEETYNDKSLTSDYRNRQCVNLRGNRDNLKRRIKQAEKEKEVALLNDGAIVSHTLTTETEKFGVKQYADLRAEGKIKSEILEQKLDGWIGAVPKQE